MPFINESKIKNKKSTYIFMTNTLSAAKQNDQDYILQYANRRKM